MESVKVEEVTEETIGEFIELACSFDNSDKLETIIHGSFNYMLVHDSTPIGVATMFRSSKYWSFHIYNVSIVKKFSNIHLYKFFIEQILALAHREGGYNINVICYDHKDSVLMQALEKLNFELTRSDVYDFKLYTIFQPVHHF